MTVRNRWNGNFYKVLNLTDSKAELQRADGSTFIIARTEYNFSYSEK